MKFTQTVLFGLVGLATAIPSSFTKRSAATIEADLAAISTELDSFDTAINAFTGSLLQGLVLVSVFDTLQTDIETATDDVISTGALSSSDSAIIYTEVDALSTNIVDVLGDTEAKASTVASAGYTSYVSSALESLQTDTADFFTALETTIYSAYTSNVTVLAATVDAAFEAAIAAY